ELRRRLGDEIFFKAIRHYVDKNQGKAVETVDLARAIEEAIGHNFDRFFDQYVFSPGHPSLKVEARYEPEQKRLRIKVQQKQKTTGEGALPVFRFPLDVRVLVGVKPTSQRLDVTDAEQTFYVACDDEPSAATID